jgi:transcriptional regulator with XRE-family HTH domain
MTVSALVELSNLSKSYISQVKHGKRAPSPKLIESLPHLVKQSKPHVDYIALFIKSLSECISPNTLEFYNRILNRTAHIAQPSIKSILSMDV